MKLNRILKWEILSKSTQRTIRESDQSHARQCILGCIGSSIHTPLRSVDSWVTCERQQTQNHAHHLLLKRTTETWRLQDNLASRKSRGLACLQNPRPLAGQLNLAGTFRVSTEFMVATVRGSWLLRGMLLVTRVFASSEYAWDPITSSSAK
jgi:hypothetical protein